MDRGLSYLLSSKIFLIKHNKVAQKQFKIKLFTKLFPIVSRQNAKKVAGETVR